MSIKDLIRKLTPEIFLARYRTVKKRQTRKQIMADKTANKFITKTQLIKELQSLQIFPGDTLLVHSSMSKMGYLENGPYTLVDALIEYIGPEGNIMMPSSPNAGLQLDYVKENKVFDVRSSPSKLGAITECFRKYSQVIRSEHPTEPVCAWGKDAVYLTSGHYNELTPYTKKSPFYRLYENKGKILYIGVTLDNAGTNLHTLEDAVDFPFPVYYPEIFEIDIINNKGENKKVKTKIHNPKWSSKRKCDHLLPMFKNEGVYHDGMLGNAKTMVFDGEKMFQSMIKNFKENGITMYHPHG